MGNAEIATNHGGAIMSAEIQGKMLIITINMQEPVLPKSGKNLVMATSKGKHPTLALSNGKQLRRKEWS